MWFDAPQKPQCDGCHGARRRSLARIPSRTTPSQSASLRMCETDAKEEEEEGKSEESERRGKEDEKQEFSR